MSTPDSELLRIEVAPDEDGGRLDALLVRHVSGVGRKGAAALIADGAVRIERSSSATPRPMWRKGEQVSAGDVVLVALTAAALARAIPSTAPPTPRAHPAVILLHEDAHVLVVCKPAGLPSHPLHPDETETAANHLAWLDPGCAASGGPPREGGLCHRLDTLTSGLLLAARTPEAYRELRRQFQAHEVEKTYAALVHGTPPSAGQVDAPILSRRGHRAVLAGQGLPARTSYRRVRSFHGAALVEAVTRTGRRHQIRAHLALDGHPLVADELYGGGALPGWSLGPLLHASRVTFRHPARGRQLTLDAPLPTAVQQALDRLQA